VGANLKQSDTRAEVQLARSSTCLIRIFSSCLFVIDSYSIKTAGIFVCLTTAKLSRFWPRSEVLIFLATASCTSDCSLFICASTSPLYIYDSNPLTEESLELL